jgi:uncharacterized Tic20 family protein
MGIAAMNDPYSPPSEPIAPPQTGLSNEERTWALVAHLSALTGLLTGFGMILGPLVVWLINKDSKPFAAAEAKEALNFNISWMLWGILLGIAAFILTFVLVGILLWIALGFFSIVWIILCIIAGIKANEGVPYRYPLTVRFIS